MARMAVATRSTEAGCRVFCDSVSRNFGWEGVNMPLRGIRAAKYPR